MKDLHAQLVQFERYIGHYDLCNNTISIQPIGRHIQHCFLVMKEIMEQVIASNPKEYTWSFNIGRIVVLWTWYIPRGRAKAPDFTLPKESITHISLQIYIKELHILLDNFITITDPHKRCQHPFFGKLDYQQSLRNMIIHNYHHLKIINDIFTS